MLIDLEQGVLLSLSLSPVNDTPGLSSFISVLHRFSPDQRANSICIRQLLFSSE